MQKTAAFFQAVFCDIVGIMSKKAPAESADVVAGKLSELRRVLFKEGFGLNAKVTQEEVKNLELSETDTFVCFDNALDDTTKVNIMRNLTVKTI